MVSKGYLIDGGIEKSSVRVFTLSSELNGPTIHTEYNR